MSLFDSAKFECPSCKSEIIFQSKAGECLLLSFDWEFVPFDIAVDISDSTAYCQNCGQKVMAKVSTPLAEVVELAKSLEEHDEGDACLSMYLLLKVDI